MSARSVRQVHAADTFRLWLIHAVDRENVPWPQDHAMRGCDLILNLPCCGRRAYNSGNMQTRMYATFYCGQVWMAGNGALTGITLNVTRVINVTSDIIKATGLTSNSWLPVHVSSAPCEGGPHVWHPAAQAAYLGHAGGPGSHLSVMPKAHLQSGWLCWIKAVARPTAAAAREHDPLPPARTAWIDCGFIHSFIRPQAQAKEERGP